MATVVIEPVLDAYLIGLSADQIAEGASAGLAAAIIAGIVSLYITVQYQNLANNYYKLYRDQREFYYTNFQTNGEAPLTTQVFDNPLAGNGQAGILYQPEYVNESNVIGGFTVHDFSGNQDFLNGDWWDRHANFYGVRALRNTVYRDAFGGILAGNAEPIGIDIAASIDDGTNYLYRYEEHRKDVYDERTWEWQNQALNFGVKQANVVQSGLATSFKFLDDAAEGMSDFFATQSNGLAMQSGYKNSFNRTGSQLAASSERGSSLGISTNLGSGDYTYGRGSHPMSIGRRITEGPSQGVA